MGCVRQGRQHAALPDQVAKHEEAHQCHRSGGHQPGDNRYYNGEQDPHSPGDALGLVGHAQAAVLLRGDQLDGKGLDDGDQRHIGVGRYGNGPNVVGAQRLRHQQRGWAVRRADNSDGGGILQVETQQHCNDDSEEDARLSRRTAQEQLRVSQQGTEVDHGPNADEQQQGHSLAGLNARLKEPLNDAGGLPHPGAELVNDSG